LEFRRVLFRSSEGSLCGERSFAALRMTKSDALFFEMDWNMAMFYTIISLYSGHCKVPPNNCKPPVSTNNYTTTHNGKSVSTHRATTPFHFTPPYRKIYL